MRKTTVLEATSFTRICSLVIAPLILIVCLASPGMAQESKAKAGEKEPVVSITLEGAEPAIPLYTKDHPWR